jgi:dTDP-4-amino-4,6-dideoxygalactose transaminase
MISVFGSKVGKTALKRIEASIDKQWLGMGPNVYEFEKKFSERRNLQNFLMVDSASNGLYTAIKLLDLPKGSDVIIPSYTWISCAHAALLAGCNPVFADVDINTLNVTAETVERAMTKNTKAIMVVHYAGLPVDIDPILKFGLPVVEDAAHAVDASYNGKACGSIGTVGVYSFDGTKNLAIGEGGGMTMRSSELYERAKLYRYCGIGKSGFEASTYGKDRWWEYNIVDAHIKMLPSDIAAAIALDQLEDLDKLQAYRKKIWDTYQKEFGNEEWIIRPVEARECDKHGYFTYSIRVPKRDQFAKYLYENEIYTTLRYHPLHMNKIYNSDAKLPNCEQLNEDAICIPLHPNLTEDDVEKIIRTVKSFKKFL